MKILLVVAALFHADGWMDRQTDKHNEYISSFTILQTCLKSCQINIV